MLLSEKCPICGGRVEQEEVTETLAGDNSTTPVKVLTGVCQVCGEHYYGAGTVRRLEKKVSDLSELELNALITDLVEEKNGVYDERNKCVILMARMAIALGLKAGRWYHEGEEEGWGWIISILLPTGWVEWHIPNEDIVWCEDLPIIEREWESYATQEKYQRVLEARFVEGLED
jgi:YgiT-type zinc finger domain-containing protein